MSIKIITLLVSLFLVTFCDKSLKYLGEDDIPEYLSIEAETAHFRKYIRIFVENRLHVSYEKYQNLETLLQLLDILGNTDNIQKEAEPWHTTVLYIGNNKKQLDSPIYKNFKEGVHVDLKLATMIYVPDRIIFAPVFPNYDKIDNKYPHVTLFTGLYPAVDSNSVLAAIFSIPEYKELYDSGKFKDDSTAFNIEINNLEITQFSGKKEVIEKVYLIKTPEVQVLDAVTTKKYRAKK
jgi:hypothetical protein